MRFVRRSSKTMRSNPSPRCTLNSSRQSSTSSAIPSSFVQSPHSLISPTHSDVETVITASRVIDQGQYDNIAPQSDAILLRPTNVILLRR